MLRPNFIRTQIGDVELFERHVEHFIQAIPRDGSTIRLDDLFIRFSLDVATDLLFGESTNTLAPDLVDAEVTEFVDAFAYCLRALDGTSVAEEEDRRTGFFRFLSLFWRNPKLKLQVQVVNSMPNIHPPPSAGFLCCFASAPRS